MSPPRHHQTQPRDETTPPITVSEKTKLQLPMKAWVSLAGFLALGVAAWTLAQARIADLQDTAAKLEHRADRNDAQAEENRRMLERIDERTVEIQRQIDKLVAR